MTTIKCTCGTAHRTHAAVVRCAVGPALDVLIGAGPYAVIHGFKVPGDRGRRWNRASRVHVHLFDGLEEARDAINPMPPAPCSGTCIGHGLATVERAVARTHSTARPARSGKGNSNAT